MALSSRIIERYSPRSPVPLPSSASLPSHWLWQERVRRIHRGNRVNDCNVSPRLWAKGVRDQEDGLRHGQGSFAILPLARRKSDPLWYRMVMQVLTWRRSTSWWQSRWYPDNLLPDLHCWAQDGALSDSLSYCWDRSSHSARIHVSTRPIDACIGISWTGPGNHTEHFVEYYILISRCVAQDFSQSAYLMWFSWEHTTRHRSSCITRYW